MEKRLASVLVCWLLAGSLSAGALVQPQDWKQYSYPNDGFALSSPSKPVIVEEKSETASGTIEIHNYLIDLGNNSAVKVSSVNLPPMDMPAKELLQAGKAGAVESMNATISSEKEITLDGNPGLEFEAKADTVRVRARVYMVKTRLLTLLAKAPSGAPFPAEVSRIFDSVKLIKPAP